MPDGVELGSVFHVYNRGVARERIFPRSGFYVFFLLRVRRYFQSPDAALLAYCLMPNHFHLLLEVKRDALPRGMHGLQMSYSKAVNEELRRVGPIFQGRYHAKSVSTDEQLLHLTRYIHLNPVDAGLASRPDQWPYSSYRAYVGRASPRWVETKLALDVLAPGGSTSRQRSRYRDFVSGSPEFPPGNAGKGAGQS